MSTGAGIILEKILWTDEPKSNLCHDDWKSKVWRRKGTAHDPKHRISSVKQGGGNAVAFMAASV